VVKQTQKYKSRKPETGRTLGGNRPSLGQARFAVQGQQPDSGPANRCQRFDSRSDESKVVSPMLFSRVIQHDDFACLRVHRGKIASLAAVAQYAAESEIFRRCFTSMFLRNNVINLVNGKGHAFWHATVLATAVCALSHKSPQFRRDVS
jgi:hypothetical protein